MFTSIFLRFLSWEAALWKNNPQRIIENLQIREGQAIADIGSGGGYFTLEFARRVGKSGRVYRGLVTFRLHHSISCLHRPLAYLR
jgi:arsenite methyltransferase